MPVLAEKVYCQHHKHYCYYIPIINAENNQRRGKDEKPKQPFIVNIEDFSQFIQCQGRDDGAYSQKNPGQQGIAKKIFAKMPHGIYEKARDNRIFNLGFQIWNILGQLRAYPVLVKNVAVAVMPWNNSNQPEKASGKACSGNY